MTLSQQSTTRIPLPIDEVLPSLKKAFQSHPTVILRASPGAGKTTRVPPALLDICEKQILVLEPRRLAARLSAERIASEYGERVGETVGYHIRFEQKLSDKTRIKFITEGLFLRYLLSDKLLSTVDCVVLDEFHERNLHTDIALALAKQLQQTTRPDLKILVMSATLNTEQLSTYFPQAHVLTSEVAQYPVEMAYFQHTEKFLDRSVYAAVEKLLLNPQCTGHILVFLPGQSDIQQCLQSLSHLRETFDCELLALYGSQPPAEQQKVFVPSVRRKIIFSTNVAETSLTIPGVTGVVDSCLAKVSGFAAWSGMPTLDLKKISQASCIQRAGRAGRTAPGCAIRLISEREFQTLAAFEKPEILRSDLTHLLLELLSLSQNGRSEFLFENIPWLEAPLEKNVQTCLTVLKYLGAIDAEQKITPNGIRMGTLSLHPRLARLALKGIELKESTAAILLASLISEGTFLKTEREGHHAVSDFDASLDWYFHNADDTKSFSKLPGPLKRTLDLAQQIARQLKQELGSQTTSKRDENLAIACLYAFPDRVAQKRKRSTNMHGLAEYTMSLGRGAVLSKRSHVHPSEFLLVLDGDEMASTQNAAQSISIRAAYSIEPELLLEDPAGFLQDVKNIYWDAAAQRVRATDKLTYGNLTVEEKLLSAADGEAQQVLATALKTHWPKPFEDDTALSFYHNRIELLKKNKVEAEFKRLDGDAFESFLISIAEGKTSFADVSEHDLDFYIQQQLSYEQQQIFQKWLPTHVKIGSGRSVRVNYEADKPPWIASRLQDFFGTLKTPTILQGRLPLVVHLLAPNMRAVQVTTDLESFWKSAYAEVRKELSRRYPRHSWPEDPIGAEPPPLKRK